MMVENKRLGNKIRKLRISKGMNLTAFAKKIDKTPSYLSQIERGVASPSIMALREIAKALNVPMFHFLIDDRKQSIIVRKNKRKVLQFPKSHLTYELLSPDASHRIQMIRTQIKVGASSCSKPLSHESEECTLVMEGKMKIEIGDDFFVLEEGDSIYYVASIPHKITSVGDKDLVIVSASTPTNF
ncbi:MAG: XRE family transcriptional regulator [Candidatus Caldatribacteriota bacterium]|nr:XRE family transcriptional regulator [Candidatus Caldatribacteriota bacterium]